MNIYGKQILGDTLANGGEIDGDLVVTGDGEFENLTVNDTLTATTIITDQELKVVDPIILMGKDNPADAVNLGILEEYTDGTKKYSGLLRDRTTKQQYLLEGVFPEPNTTTNLTLLPRGHLNTGSLTNANYTLPTSDGTPGQIISTNGAGTLTFTDDIGRSLQSSYDLSSEPQITTTVANDTMVIKQGIGVPANILEVQDENGDPLMEVKSDRTFFNQEFVRHEPTAGDATNFIRASGGSNSTLVVGGPSSNESVLSQVQVLGNDALIELESLNINNVKFTSGSDKFNIIQNNFTSDVLQIETGDIPDADVRLRIKPTESAFGPNEFIILRDTGELEFKDALIKSFNPTIQFEGALPTSQSLINMGTPANTQNAFIQCYSNTTSAIDLASEKRAFLRWGNQNDPIDEFCIERDFNIGVGDVEFIFRPFGGATKRIPITIPISGDEVKINKLNVNGTYTLPDVDGTPNQVLKTDGSGVVSWSSETASSETLQEAYDASSSPQIVTTGINPTLTVRAGVSSPPFVVSDQSSNPLMVVQTTGQVVIPRLNDSTQNSINWLTQNNPSNSWEIGNIISSTDLSVRNGAGSDVIKMSQNGTVRINDAYDLPTISGTSGQYLRTDGSGATQWSDIPTQAQFVQTQTLSATNSTILTELTGTGLGTRLIPANTLVVGSSYRICFRGLCETDGAGEDITFFLRVNDGLGNTTVIAQMNVDFTNVGTLNPYDAEFNFTVRSIGNNGSCLSAGQFNYLDNNSLEGDKFNGLSTGLDTTSDQTIELFGLWSAAQASNVLILNQMTIERLSGATTGNVLSFSAPISSVDVLELQSAKNEFLAMKQDLQNCILKIQGLTL